MTLTVTTVLLLILTILCTSMAQILQKQAAIELDSNVQSRLPVNPSVIKSMVLLAVGMGLWLLVLKRLDVSLAYPLLSANFIVVPLLAYWRFGEEIPANRMVGAAVIIAGMVCLFSGSPA